jgi:Fe/S biogenesis protein NfuA
MITFTDKARDKVLELIQAEGQPGLALRVGIKGRGPGGFQYDLRFVEEDDRAAEDVVVDADGFQVFVDPESASNLKGSSVEYVSGLPTPGHDSGFKIENPNQVWSDPMAVAVQEVIDTRINPGVGMHGGHVTLLDVKEGVAFIALGGGCQGCGMANVTLKQGIDVMIREAVPSIREIIDTTDHAAGRNPYYQPSKSGESPLV